MQPNHDPTTPTITPFTAAANPDSKKHLLLATTGSVATIKLPLLVSLLTSRHPPSSSRLAIHILTTASSLHFLPPTSIASLQDSPLVERVWTDADEWATPYGREVPVLHIELRRWADLLVVAPLSANSMAKMCVGICDNLLLSVVRAWDGGGGDDSGEHSGAGSGIVVAPAMNTRMWKHPVTAGQVKTLGGWGVEVLGPVEKTLACGDVGIGGMVGIEEIVEVIERRLGLN